MRGEATEPVPGFRFTVPPGFRHIVTRARVIARVPAKAVIIFGRARKRPKKGPEFTAKSLTLRETGNMI